MPGERTGILAPEKKGKWGDGQDTKREGKKEGGGQLQMLGKLRGLKGGGEAHKINQKIRTMEVTRKWRVL